MCSQPTRSGEGKCEFFILLFLSLWLLFFPAKNVFSLLMHCSWCTVLQTGDWFKILLMWFWTFQSHQRTSHPFFVRPFFLGTGPIFQTLHVIFLSFNVFFCVNGLCLFSHSLALWLSLVPFFMLWHCSDLQMWHFSHHFAQMNWINQLQRSALLWSLFCWLTKKQSVMCHCKKPVCSITVHVFPHSLQAATHQIKWTFFFLPFQKLLANHALDKHFFLLKSFSKHNVTLCTVCVVCEQVFKWKCIFQNALCCKTNREAKHCERSACSLSN